MLGAGGLQGPSVWAKWCPEEDQGARIRTAVEPGERRQGMSCSESRLVREWSLTQGTVCDKTGYNQQLRGLD